MGKKMFQEDKNDDNDIARSVASSLLVYDRYKLLRFVQEVSQLVLAEKYTYCYCTIYYYLLQCKRRKKNCSANRQTDGQDC